MKMANFLSYNEPASLLHQTCRNRKTNSQYPGGFYISYGIKTHSPTPAHLKVYYIPLAFLSHKEIVFFLQLKFRKPQPSMHTIPLFIYDTGQEHLKITVPFMLPVTDL
jgi:hypothetical protein